jgi:folylpolyglutamate synthase/dihydropteroate synthase
MGRAAENEVVLVTGSVYLVGEVYPWFLARQGRQGLFPEAAR